MNIKDELYPRIVLHQCEPGDVIVDIQGASPEYLVVSDDESQGGTHIYCTNLRTGKHRGVDKYKEVVRVNAELIVKGF